MQYVQLELTHENFFCPVTGHHVVGPDTPFTPSKAMLGLWHDFCSEADIYDRRLREQWDEYVQACKKKRQVADVEKFLRNVMDNFPYVCFEITTEGMACGPMSFTRWFVFNMDFDVDYEEDEDEDGFGDSDL